MDEEKEIRVGDRVTVLFGEPVRELRGTVVRTANHGSSQQVEYQVELDRFSHLEPIWFSEENTPIQLAKGK